MLGFTQYIIPPVIGAVIGYITNYIAIKMLFRPHTAKYIMGIRLPFTPGIIPKEKARIASSIGNAISTNLMNREVLEQTLLSDEMTGKISAAIDSFAAEQRRNHESVESFLSRFLSPGEIAAVKGNIASGLSGKIQGALATSDLGGKIARIAVEHVMGKMKSGGIAGGILSGAGQMLGFLTSPLENLLAKNINSMLAEHSAEIAGPLINDQIDNFLNLSMAQLLEGKEKQIGEAKQTIVSLYRNLISTQLPRILSAINISKVIEDRINGMGMDESERLLLEVMDRELKAIVWLGALLGFLMGCVNLLFL